MKYLITFVCAVAVSQFNYGQKISTDKFNEQRIKITRQSMIVIGSWGAANLIYSGAFAGAARGSNKYFYDMNLIWGGVNFSLGCVGYLFSKKTYGLSYAESLKKQITVEKIFLFNTGLDVAYVAGGFYLKEKSNNNSKNKERNKGYGESIILQGSSLFIFDGLMYLIHKNHGKQLLRLLDNLEIGATNNGIACIIKL